MWRGSPRAVDPGQVEFALEGAWVPSLSEAEFTCPADVVAPGDDPIRNPFSCFEPSNDEHEIGALGMELSWARDPQGASRWEPHLALAANYLAMEFQVDARLSGLVDRTLLITDGWTWALAAGVTYHAGRRWQVLGETFFSPLQVARPTSESTQNDFLFNIRTLISYRIR